ncbi:hypothetical protein Q1695_003445 [Nippostrongylus brasiliensis]|nr:hypothetical protein Q1695_003445 [Nippostrongylus brasiliensis]
MAPDLRQNKSIFLAGLAGDKRPAPYKHLPVYPLTSPAVDFSFRNISKIHPPCTNCFPQTSQDRIHNYVDVFDFSKFGGIPYPVLDGAQKPSPWFADLRYTIATPLPHSYPGVYEEVIESPRVAAAIQSQIDGSDPASEKTLQRKVVTYYYEIRATLSRFICKICGYLLFKVFRRLMTHLLVSPQQMKLVVEAEKTGTPLVYLPLHRSHLDYLMITWTAWHFGLRLPHIASGDNLNLSGLGWLLRATGAFFIRRRIDENDEGGRDISYRAVLHSYIEQLLGKGLSIEFFLEGTRCRFGKSQLPKHGLISNIVKAVQEHTIEDCYLVPVSYTYDSVAEGVFLDELMGVPKKRESVLGVLYGVLRSFGKPKRCGAVRMHFGTPVLLSDYMSALQEALAANSATPQLSCIPHVASYRELVPWHSGHTHTPDDRTLIRAIGYHVVKEAQSIVSISLVSVVSSLLLCKFREGVAMEVLAADCQWLCDQILLDGSDVVGWRNGETCGQSAVQYALPFIRSSVERTVDLDVEEGNRVAPIQTHRQLINLAFNKNALVPLFALKSAIGLALISRDSDRTRFEDIVEDTALICDCMQFEIIFYKPCENLRSLIMATLGKQGLSHAQFGLLSLMLDEEVFAGGDTFHLKFRDALSREIVLFYSNFLRPFLQSLYIVVDRVLSGDVKEKQLTTVRHWCSAYVEQSCQTPFTLLLEAVNSDSFRNSLRLLLHKGIISDDLQVVQMQYALAMRSNLERLLKIY